MAVQLINPDVFPKPLAAYSYATRQDNTIYTAGMISLDHDGKIVGEGDIAAQTRQTLENLKIALEAAGATLQDVTKTTIFLTDFADYKGMNGVYSEYFGAHPPARSCVRCDLVLPQLLVEIEAIAQVNH